jgi:hypothetical protein
MKRFLGLSLSLLCCATLGVVAGDLPKLKPEPPAPKKNPAEIKEDPDKKPGAESKEEDDKRKELISRIGKNMEQSGERLGKKDPGDATRQIQGDIVKDLDALIDQNKKQQQQQQQQQQQASNSSSKSKSNNGKSSSSSSSSSQNNKAEPSPSQSKSGGGQEPQGQAKDPGKDGKEQQPGQAKKDDQNGQGQPGPAREKGKDGQGLLGRAKEAQGKGILAELFRDTWGHLPELRRQEMDAYSRDRFLHKYEDLLKQYYRTISEQSNR